MGDRNIRFKISKSERWWRGGQISIINRIVPYMVQSGEMLRSEDILDILILD